MAEAAEECRLAVRVGPGTAETGPRPTLRIRLPARAPLARVFALVASGTGQSAEDFGAHFQLEAREPGPPHRSRLLSASADGERTLEDCGLAPHAALVAVPAARSPRAAAARPSEAAELTQAQAAEADRAAVEHEKVQAFCAFTGADPQTAAVILERVGWEVQGAINHFFEAGAPDAGGAGGGAEGAEAPAGALDMYTDAEAAPSAAGGGGEPLPEGVTPPSHRADAGSPGDSRELLAEWLRLGQLEEFGTAWADAGLVTLGGLRALPAERPWEGLPEPRPRVFEGARLRRLLLRIDEEAVVQGCDAPRPPPPPALGGSADPAGLRQWFADANLEGYAERLVERGGLMLEDVAHVTEEELIAVGMEKAFHRKRFLRHRAAAPGGEGLSFSSTSTLSSMGRDGSGGSDSSGRQSSG